MYSLTQKMGHSLLNILFWWWVGVLCFFVTMDLRCAEMPLKVGIRLAEIDFVGVSMIGSFDFCHNLFFKYLHDGLTWERGFANEKVLFP